MQPLTDQRPGGGLTLDKTAFSSSGLCWGQRRSWELSARSVAGVGGRWHSLTPSKGPLTPGWVQTHQLPFPLLGSQLLSHGGHLGGKEAGFQASRGEGVIDGTGDSALPSKAPHAAVLGEPVLWWGWGQGLVCYLTYTAGSIWEREAGGLPPGWRRNGNALHATPTPNIPPPPASPVTLQGCALQPALDPGKIDCLFLPGCPTVTAALGEGRGGLLPPPRDGFLCFCACRKSGNRTREAAQGGMPCGRGHVRGWLR